MLLRTVPLKNVTLKRLTALDPDLIKHPKLQDSLQALAKSLPNVVPVESHGELSIEISKYQVDAEVVKISEMMDEKPEKEARIDSDFWSKVLNLKVKDNFRYPVLGKLVSALLSIFCGPLIEATFNIMDDIIEKDRTKMTVKNYEDVAIIKTGLKRRNANATTLKVNKAMTKSCMKAYQTYTEHLKKKN